MTVVLLLTGEALILVLVVCLMRLVGPKDPRMDVLTEADSIFLVQREFPEFTPDRIFVAADHRGALLSADGRDLCVLFRLGVHWVVWSLPDDCLCAQDRGCLVQGASLVTMRAPARWNQFSRWPAGSNGTRIRLRTGTLTVPEIDLYFCGPPTE